MTINQGDLRKEHLNKPSRRHLQLMKLFQTKTINEHYKGLVRPLHILLGPRPSHPKKNGSAYDMLGIKYSLPPEAC